ncbi:MAG TPA: helix-turn-helix domain-containing protein [Streptosporangiaceae bacterium]|nr:helix-turn-helix domain-containing protein [Streptosporangiaceae bacterium]
MARPRVIDDERLLAAAQQVLFDVGPAVFTLQRVAERAGVSAATLIKRFGSKQQIFVELDRRWVASIEPGLAAAEAGCRSPLERLRAAALWGFDDLDSPANTANELAALALDLEDDTMRGLLASGWQVIEDHLTACAAEAIAAGELGQGMPAAQIARILLATAEGTRITWCVRPVGSLVERAEADLEVVLAALVTASYL